MHGRLLCRHMPMSGEDAFADRYTACIDNSLTLCLSTAFFAHLGDEEPPPHVQGRIATQARSARVRQPLLYKIRRAREGRRRRLPLCFYAASFLPPYGQCARVSWHTPSTTPLTHLRGHRLAYALPTLPAFLLRSSLLTFDEARARRGQGGRGGR